ncbi:heat-inducible transcriptional repressor HrcA [Gehongia tenuis]|uniref:Heat-inducible transcription repressor HrcA n=1 Tax=Gehongia tenuis TaxID=2763655 RepID=A0A926D3N0_9FIRM|nr:heat-inducible transcriptional repressor HrcA [Gehongia tenuis]MBC8530902.1 heat-inducible transcription repressor HrcA [Gehongia tenuis]
MELSSRKLEILKAIVDDFIVTGVPVGSRTISKKSGMGLSSATIRNEMSDLEELGLLEQPHTSAGRVPSQLAYRLYVDRLMRVERLTKPEIDHLRGYFTQQMDEVEQVIDRTAKILSDATHYTSMVLAPKFDNMLIKGVHLVPISQGLALLVVVTDKGVFKDTTMRIPGGIDPEYLHRISGMLTERLAGLRPGEVQSALREFLKPDLGAYRQFFKELMDAVEQNFAAGEKREVVLGGAANILNYPEYSDMDKARNFLMTLETKDVLYELLNRASKMEFSVTIGTENEFEQMRDCSVVTATYKIGDQTLGSFGVIGPTRMDYGKVISVLDYMGKSLGEILSELMKRGEI